MVNKTSDLQIVTPEDIKIEKSKTWSDVSRLRTLLTVNFPGLTTRPSSMPKTDSVTNGGQDPSNKNHRITAPSSTTSIHSRTDGTVSTTDHLRIGRVPGHQRIDESLIHNFAVLHHHDLVGMRDC